MFARSPMKRTRRNTGPTSSVVDAVLERANHSCEACSAPLGDRRGVDWSVQHRRPRAMGGSRWPGINLPSNLMILCGSATTGCHGFAESHRSSAVAAGWLILSHDDPTKVPALIGGDRWWYLTDDGTYSVDPEVAA